MPSFRVSVVIPTYNRKDSLLCCLESLRRQTLSLSEFEVIVVDDGSTDATGETLRNSTWPFRLQYVFQQNSGPSQARNVGVRNASGEIIAFTEDDVEVRPDWLMIALAYFKDQSLALLEGRTVYSGTDKDVRRFEATPRHSFIPCNLFIKKDVFEKVGGYDPAFFDPRRKLYFREDADLGFRILEEGFVSRIAADVVTEHPSQFRSLSACVRHARRYVFDPLLYRKHPARFRQLIEVKEMFGLSIRRPQHYLSLLYAIWVVGLISYLIMGDSTGAIGSALLKFVSSSLFRYKYQGAGALKLHRLDETLVFLAMPIIYLTALIKGCFRFKSFGALL